MGFDGLERTVADDFSEYNIMAVNGYLKMVLVIEFPPRGVVSSWHPNHTPD